jgi:peroxin-3
MTLIPTLGQQILVEMDVEGVTEELQAKSRTPRSPTEPPPPAPSESSLASSIDLLQDHDARSDAGSISVSSFSGSGMESNLGEPQNSVEPLSPRPDDLSRELSNESAVPSSELLQGTMLSESILTTNSALSGRVRATYYFSDNVDLTVVCSQRV